MPPTDGETHNAQSQNQPSHNTETSNSTTSNVESPASSSSGTISGTSNTGKVAIDSHPFSPISSKPITNHIHFTCSRCNTTLDYDIWNSCVKPKSSSKFPFNLTSNSKSKSQSSPDNPNQPISAPRQGPCNHCILNNNSSSDGESIVRRHCSIIRCEKCLEEGGMQYLLRVRNQRLEAEGYVRRSDTLWEKPGYPGKWGIAGWELVRYGACTEEMFGQRENLEVRMGS